MRNVIIQAVCFFAALMASVSCTVENEKVISADSEKDKVAIERLIDQYIETINRCDTALVNAIWSHDAKVSFIGPSGYYSTYEEIRDSLVVGGFGSHFSKRDLRKDKLKIDVNGNAAWSEFTWTFDAVRTDGSAHSAKGRETQIFEKESEGKWRLIHIHYSAVR